MRFDKVYGKIGAGFIEVHRLRPVSRPVDSADPVKELIPLCSNCHRMIHRRSPALSVAELRECLDLRGAAKSDGAAI
ncbi:HNH endonuclease [Opitutus terrae]